MQTVDAHIHLEQYPGDRIRSILDGISEDGVRALVAVSMGPASCLATQRLQREYPGRVYPAYGFHPEQPLPSETEMQALIRWIRENAGEAAAIGEIGLPYYNRKDAEKAGKPFDLAPYLEVLDRLLALAAELGKPVALHAVYEDADLVCGMLENHGIEKAHFHWFKGSPRTVERMIRNGYRISFTPDIAYEPEIRSLARAYPLDLVMAETDGPWPFEGPYEGEATHPRMTRDVVREIATLKRLPLQETGKTILQNTLDFYGIPSLDRTR